MRGQSYDICAAVVSDLRYDARVWKEARSLAAEGYRVALLGCNYDIRRPRWRRDGAIDVFEVPLGSRKRVSLLRRARTLLRLWTEIVRTPARAYHAHNIHVGPAAWLASRLRRSPLVYDVHELYGQVNGYGVLNGPIGRLHAALDRFMFRKSGSVITTNESRASILRERHRRDSIVVLENVPELREKVEPCDPGYPTAPVLLYQGGVYARSRAFRETIQALRLLEGVHFVVLGFGRADDLALVRRWAEDEGVSQRVHLLPPRPYSELVGTAAAATVGLVPIKAGSLSHYTGEGNKLFEYLMAGLPVVGSDLPELRRVMSAGDPSPGELFDPALPESIASAVERVLADPELYRARRAEARRLALERYNWQAQEYRLLDIYRSRLGHAPSTAVAEAGTAR